MTRASLFDDLFPVFFQPEHHGMSELTDDLDLYVKVPGCGEKDVDVELGEKLITVKAKASVDGFDFTLNKNYLIPRNVDRDNIKATVQNGLLTISSKRNVEKLKVKKLL